MKNHDNHVFTRGFAYLFLGIVCLLQLLPFWLAICTASKPATDLSSTLVPRTKDIEWSNFTLAITEGGVLRAMVNSAIITVCATVLTCVIGAMAAYPLARRLSKFNKVVSTVILSLMMIPPLSVLVPVYSMMVKIGGVNTYWGIILLSTAGNLPLAIFLYTSFIKAIPVSIDEAGMIDGANRATIFFRLIMPHHDQCRRLERIRHVQLPAHRPGLPAHRAAHRVVLRPAEQQHGRRSSGSPH